LQGAGRPDAAIESYRAALAIRSDYAEARYNLGVTLDVQGHEQDAVSCYEKTLELKPDHASASFNLAVLLAKLGRTDEAISRYQQWHHPSFPDTNLSFCKLSRTRPG